MNTRILAALVAIGLLQVALADDIAEKGRAVFQKYKDTVVTVRVAVSVSDGSGSDDNGGWANGAIVDPSGLTVVALSFLDPTGIYAKLDDQNSPQPNVKITSLRIIFEDGNEVPATVVLRDNDLDLAFIRPIEPPKSPLPSVDLSNSAEPKLLDNVVILSQLGEVARRAHSAAIERIETVVDKPRHYFMVGAHRSDTILSAPVFTLEGQFIGIGAMRAIAGATETDPSDSVLVVIVPAKDIKDGAAQAPAKPAAEPTEAPTKQDAPKKPEEAKK